MSLSLQSSSYKPDKEQQNGDWMCCVGKECTCIDYFVDMTIVDAVWHEKHAYAYVSVCWIRVYVNWSSDLTCSVFNVSVFKLLVTSSLLIAHGSFSSKENFWLFYF